ncbi:MAG: Cobalt-zinc-cadmium resistance protein [uncultured Thermomicrobiales bacterium]|uniref:Cobalt-zinc-cadmium resistance protein n=1 Tax=uncultured Thermomicrobiales bacterium TaxID=1645740 RepID=A0A6J4UHA8_9BACT|nr:MAG: Cobalt-zinc-cadmium resistance protein [uncultured Thermomicrobiales bacterium]
MMFPFFLSHRSRTERDANAIRLRAGWLAIVAAVVTIALKFTAYALTGSAGLLSDAVESLANLVTASAVLISIWYASRPVDRSHNYGHGKVEFFASGVEGLFIVGAAVAIGWIGVIRLFDPHELESLGLGTVIAIAASAVNLLVARMLIRVGRAYRSPALTADGRHVMTDVWTTGGVLIGLGIIAFTGWLWVDALIALVLAVNIAFTGWRLIAVGVNGLMDRALPLADERLVREAVETALRDAPDRETTFHALRTREAGSRRFVDFHLLVPGRVSVGDAHALASDLEQVVDRALPGVETTIHIEPLEDDASYRDSDLLVLEDGPERAHRVETGSGFR